MSSSAPPPPPPGSGGSDPYTPPPGTGPHTPPGADPYGANPYAATPQAGSPYGTSPYGTAPQGRPGGLGERFVARLLDFLLLAVVLAIINGAIIAGMLGMNGGTFGYGGSVAAGAISAVLSTVAYLGYFGLMESTQGRTLGKMVMKLRVDGPNGGKPTLVEAVKRNIWLGLPILGVVPVLGGLVAGLGQLIAIIMIAVGINNDPARRQPWTDKFAGGTQVVKEG